tara:strand:- start:1469 stop:1813 length:345 start_codon:yes stop_codon:yes gene_type:complete
MDIITTYKKAFDVNDEFIFDKNEGGVRLLQSILLKAVVEVTNKDLLWHDRLQAAYWLFLDQNEDEVVIRALALKLLNFDLGYVRRKVIDKIGQKEYGQLLFEAMQLPEKDKFWA